MAIVSFAIQKGGAGKTTSAVMTSAWLAKRGKTVLLVDLDPQASATECVVDPLSVGNTIGDLLLGKHTLSNVIRHTGISGLDLIPSKVTLLVDEYFGHFSNIFPDLLKNHLNSVVDRYDYIICDCPPNLLHFTKNALWASEYVVIPLEPEPLAYEGLRQFIGSILPNMILHNPSLKPGGALLVHRAPQTRKYLPDQIRYDINTHHPGLLFRQEIRLDQELAKMAFYNQPACQYAPSSNGSLDYASFVVEFESRIPP